MRKVLALSLLMVLVVTVGVLASEEGKISGDSSISTDLPVVVSVGQYAKVSVPENLNKLFQDELIGEVGLYTSDKYNVQGEARKYFEKRNKTWEKEYNDTNGGAVFRIESNCDVKVSVNFDWDTEAKLNSEMILGIWHHVDGYPLVKATFEESMISTTNQEFKRPVTFLHQYKPNSEYEYKIGGAILIESISQQKADSYSGTITVTLSSTK